MRMRWKFLLILLLISIGPMLLLRWVGQESMQKLGLKLAASTRDVLIRRSGLELRTLVEEHARILRQERDLVEVMLQVQVSELEKLLAGHPPYRIDKNTKKRPKSGGTGSGAQLPAELARRLGAMGSQLKVSFREQTILGLPAGGRGAAAKRTRELADMVPIYRSLVQKHPELVYWQLTALKNGIQTIYPAIQSSPQQAMMGPGMMSDMGGMMNPLMMSGMMYQRFKDQWYHAALENGQITWSRPMTDPFTMHVVFTVSAPLYGAKGTPVGATAIVVPVNVLLKKDVHFRRISPNVISLLVRTQPSVGTDQEGIRIIARQQIQGQMHHHWRALRSAEYLAIEDKDQLKELTADLDDHRTNVIAINYKGQKSLAAYGCIDDYCTALLLIVPQKDLVAEAVSMGTYVLDQVGRQIKVTGILMALVVLVVIGLALVLSRSVTKNISRLAQAASRVAAGDFTTRVRIKSGDEIGQLGRTFNNMVPALEERINMKQSLDLAMEVQQNLLPQKMPAIEGLDIAGKSIYCDETGGDLYDFLEVSCQSPARIGIAVGDVSGHGISAALLMATARASLRSRATQPGSMAEIITDVNRLVTNDTRDSGQFMTLFYAEIDPGQKTLRWVRAGHDPAIFYDPGPDKFEQLQGCGAVLGVDGKIQYQQNVKSGLSPGQIIFIGTDGLWETHNQAGEMFGKERLKTLIRRYASLPAEKIVTSTIDSLQAFRQSVKQEDDITLVVVKVVD